MNTFSKFAGLALIAASLHAQAAAPNGPCNNCGVVVSVAPVQRASQPQGIAGTPVTPGMAIGGVVGGVLGNQVGGGSGKTVATVAGAAGGAYVGHSIEKKRATATSYVMKVRMQDGTTRTIEQRTALARGSHVFVEGKTARLQQGARRSQG